MFKFDAFFHGCLFNADEASILALRPNSGGNGINGSNNIARLDTVFTATNKVVEISFALLLGCLRMHCYYSCMIQALPWLLLEILIEIS